MARIEPGTVVFSRAFGPDVPNVIEVRNIRPTPSSDPVVFGGFGAEASENFLVETAEGDVFMSFPRGVAANVVAKLKPLHETPETR